MATSNYGIHGHLLEVTVVGCTKLKDTEWISRQDPYVCLEYANSKFRTRTCKDGGKNPTFQEKFVFTLIEGLRELSVVVWNSNKITYDDLIGSTKVQLQKVLSQGYDDSPWTLNTKTGRYAGEVRLIMHYANANANSQKPPKNYYVPSAPPHAASPVPSEYSYQQPSSYPLPSSSSSYPPPSLAPSYPPASSAFPYPPSKSAPPYPSSSSTSLYPPPSSASPYPPPSSSSSYPLPDSSSLYLPQASVHPNPSNSSYQHDSTPYPGSTYPPQPYPPPSVYPPQPYPPPSVYPPQPYPQPSVYPPQPNPPPVQSPSQYPPGPSYLGTYPPPY